MTSSPPSLSTIQKVAGLPGGSVGKESACNVGDLCSIPGLGRSPGGGHGNPLQYSRQENFMDRSVWQAIVHGTAELDTTEQLHTAQRLSIGYAVV